MSKVCVGCGLTKDTSGNLIVAASGTVGDVSGSTCTAASSGTHIYCDSTTGKLYGPPEKFYKFDRVGKSFITNSPVRITSFVPQDGVLYDISSDDRNTANVADKSPLKFTIVNPSKCLPFYVMMEAGISHGYIVWESGTAGRGSDFLVEMSAFVTVTGAMQAFSGHTGHQIWGAKTDQDNEGISFDTMGARAFVTPAGADPFSKFTIAPGGTMTVQVNPYLSLDVNRDTATINIQNYTVDVAWWGSNDA